MSRIINTDSQKVVLVIFSTFVIKLFMMYLFALEPNGGYNEKLIYTGDTGNYTSYAERIYNGTVEDTPKRAPIFPIFLLSSFIIFGKNNPLFILILQQIIYAITIYIFFKVSLHVLRSMTAALLALTIFIIDPIFFIFSFRYSNENLAILFNLLTVYYFLKLWKDEKKKLMSLLLAALFANLVVLTRPIYALFPIMLAPLLFIDNTRNFYSKVKKAFVFISASYMLIILWAGFNYLSWGYFSISGNESIKVRTTFAYHYSSYANNKPVYWDEFETFKDSLFKEYENINGSYPVLKEQNKILSDYSDNMFKKYWYVYMYLPLKYSYKFFQPGTQLYYAYTGKEEPGEHVSVTRLSEFHKEGFFTILWNKLNREPGIFIWGIYSLFFVFFVMFGFIFGVYPFLKDKINKYLIIISFILFIYTAYICGSMIQARYRVVFFWLFIIIASAGWQYLYSNYMKKHLAVLFKKK